MESHIRHMKEAVSKIFLDHVALITQTNDEIRQSIMSVDFHDTPQDRTPADLNHRLRLDRSLFRNASTQSARKNNDLHDLPKRGRRAQSVCESWHSTALSSRRHNALLQQRRFRLDRGLALWQQPRLATLIDTAAYRTGGGLGAVLDQFASLLPSRLQGVCSHRTIDRELIL